MTLIVFMTSYPLGFSWKASMNECVDVCSSSINSGCHVTSTFIYWNTEVIKGTGRSLCFKNITADT